MALHFTLGGPVVACIVTGGFMGAIIFTGTNKTVAKWEDRFF